MKMQQVKEFNQWAYNKGSYILIFTLGDGSMCDEPRKKGWVVSGYNGEDSHRFFSSKEKALNFMNNN